MRRMRRGAGGGHEFGGSGEDSFVAVVVTKLTGALLFILLLTMVIMALIPKAIDLPRPDSPGGGEVAEQDVPLEIVTPEELPEAIVGRPYTLALAASGTHGPTRWGVDGELPEGLQLDPDSGQIRGVARKGTPEPVHLRVRLRDGDRRAEGEVRLTVYESDRPLGLPSKWLPTVPAVPWRSWLDQGFGFILLLLVHMVGINAIAGLERGSLAGTEESEAIRKVHSRFVLYRWLVRAATLAAVAALAIWLAWPRGG